MLSIDINNRTVIIGKMSNTSRQVKLYLLAALAAAAALVHGRAAHVAVPGGPVTALAVADAVPATVAELLRG